MTKEQFIKYQRFVRENREAILRDGWVKVLGIVETEDEKVKNIEKAMNEVTFGCQQNRTARILSLGMGLEIDPKRTSTGNVDLKTGYILGELMAYTHKNLLSIIPGKRTCYPYPCTDNLERSRLYCLDAEDSYLDRKREKVLTDEEFETVCTFITERYTAEHVEQLTSRLLTHLVGPVGRAIRKKFEEETNE